jgi:tetratricopeptide (TPR) repeat protein
MLQGRYDEALASFKQMQDLSPKAPTANLGIGQVYLAKGDYERALTAIKVNFQPSAITYYWLGAIYAAKGDKPNALVTMQKCFDLGFRDFKTLDASPYFASLRDDPKFQAMLAKARK